MFHVFIKLKNSIKKCKVISPILINDKTTYRSLTFFKIILKIHPWQLLTAIKILVKLETKNMGGMQYINLKNVESSY